MLGCGMDIEWWKFIWLHDEIWLTLAYPVCYMIVLYVVLLSSRWSSILLMGANGRGSHGQQGSDDPAA